MDKRQRVVLIRGARQLLTLRGPKEPRRGSSMQELGIIPDGSVLIRDGVLAEVGPTRRVENLAVARGAVEIDATGCVVMPGLIDAHTHLVYPPAASTADDEESGAEHWDRFAGRSIHHVTAKRLEAKTRVYADLMLRHGTTTIESKTGCGLDEADEIKVLRVLGQVNGAPSDVIATLLLRLGESALDAVAERLCIDLMEKVRRRGMARFIDLQWSGPGALQTAERLAGFAHRLGLRLCVHGQGAGGEGCQAVEWGAVSISHLERATPRDVEALANSGTIATLLPACSFHDQSPYAPARQLLDQGAAVALGSNFNPLLTPTLNLQSVVALAVARLRMSTAEAISAATINAAHALRCAGHAGSLEFGKAADILILETGDHRDIGHHFGSNLVSTVIKNGVVVYQRAAIAREGWEPLEQAG